MMGTGSIYIMYPDQSADNPEPQVSSYSCAASTQVNFSGSHTHAKIAKGGVVRTLRIPY